MSDISQTSWFIKYAPKTIEELVFDSDEHKHLVQKWIEQDYIDGNVLLYGPFGLGKTITAEILVRSTIKAQNDVFFAVKRKVEEVRDDIVPFLKNAPKRSKKKIVYIEEMDKLHSAAFNELKTGIMEKYQNKNTFLACTNYIKKIEGGVLSRFNYKIPFTGKNVEGIIERLKYILDNENANYDLEELKKFVTKNIRVGIRELINQLQNSYISNNGIIDFQNISKESGIEENVTELILKMLTTIMNTDIKNKKLCSHYPDQSLIAQEYKTFVTLIHNNYDINFDVVYNRLMETITYIPAKKICAEYAEKQEYKKFPHLNLVSFFYEVSICLSEVNLL